MSESLADNYARAGYHARQVWGRSPALLLVDFAQAYFSPNAPLYGGEGCERARRGAMTLLAAARETGIPVVHTEVRYQKGGRDGGVFFRKVPALACFERGNPLGDPVAGLEPAEGETVITKQYPSAFFGTSLAAMLTAQRVDTLLITGLTTSGCVRASCVDAMSSGFVTLVVEDACGDRASGPHEANIFDMSAKYADVITVAEAAAFLRGLAAQQ
ncbi:MAG: isochorismatase family protein [Alphaproteobacteria bacterium]|nr:MAG: isochorismatase family protein [Alphaproteobacteria bacterium]